MKHRVAVVLLGSFALALPAHVALAQCGDHGDILVGRTADDTLAVAPAEFSFDEFVVLCAVDGLLQGYTSGNPGFDAEEVVDDPENDFFRLEPGAAIAIEAVALDPACKAWGPGLASLIDEAGESVVLGGDNLHEHLTWHVDSDDPAFDPSEVIWSATFRLIDTGSTGYAASDPFTLQFIRAAPVPAVSEWGLLITALMICAVYSLICRASRMELPEAAR